MIQLEGQTVIAKLHNQETGWVCEPKKEMKGFQFLCNSSGFFISLTLNASPNGWYLSCKYIVDIKLSSGPSNSINSYIWDRLMLMCVWILKEYLLNTKTKLWKTCILKYGPTPASFLIYCCKAFFTNLISTKMLTINWTCRYLVD